MAFDAKHVGILASVSHAIWALAVGVAVLLPALFYRWSLKGAALVYSPLIWIVRAAMDRPLRVHLEDIAQLAYYRVSRWFAVLVLAGFAIKAYIHATWGEVASSWRVIPGSQFLDVVVMPEAFPAWQVAMVVNAILAWVLYVGADWVVSRWDRGANIHERTIELVLRWLFLVRGVISIYTIACLLYLAASLSGLFELRPMGAGILPWR